MTTTKHIDATKVTDQLHAVEKGSGDKTPLLLLHGFGGTHRYWQPIQDNLAKDRRVIAFDLPGHGLSRNHDHAGRTALAASAVLAEMDRRGIGKVHLAGHSMGGAIACIIALKQNQRVSSLTLLAPGGFGPEINASFLRRFAVAKAEAELRSLLTTFYGDGTGVSGAMLQSLLQERADPKSGEILLQVAESFLAGEQQGVLPLEEIAVLEIPISVIWGTRDRITPVHQARALHEKFNVHVFENAGHSLVDEIPLKVLQILRKNMR